MAWTTCKQWNSALLCTRSVPCAVRFLPGSMFTQFHLQAAFIFHFQSSPSEVLRSTLFLKPLEVVSKVRQNSTLVAAATNRRHRCMRRLTSRAPLLLHTWPLCKPSRFLLLCLPLHDAPRIPPPIPSRQVEVRAKIKTLDEVKHILDHKAEAAANR